MKTEIQIVVRVRGDKGQIVGAASTQLVHQEGLLPLHGRRVLSEALARHTQQLFETETWKNNFKK